MADEDIPFDRSLAAKPGEATQLSPLVRRLIASNGGPFTFTGTCSYILGRDEVIVVDPGPADARHRDGLLQAIGSGTVKAILITHTHRDHSPGAEALKAATGAPILGPPAAAPAPGANWVDSRALDAAHDRGYKPDRILVDGDTVRAQDFSLMAVETPGHAAQHLCFALPNEAALFSGDHVMAWSTTVVAPPDGSMRAYMASLEKLLGRAETTYWPGHGGPVLNPARFIRALIHHRRQREHAILKRLQGGDRTIGAIVAAIYENLAPALRGAAALSVLAHLEDLEQRGLVDVEGHGLSALYRAGNAGQFSAA